MRTRTLIACGLAALALIVAGCGGDDTETADFSVDAPASDASSEPAAASKKPKVRVPSSPPPKDLETRDIKRGTGATAKKGSQVSVHYVGVSYSTKKEFESSYATGQPIDVALGQGEVIPGWDEGIVGMKAGGRRELIIPPDKAYGATGQPPDIKPNETLVFVIDLVSVD